MLSQLYSKVSNWFVSAQDDNKDIQSSRIKWGRRPSEKTRMLMMEVIDSIPAKSYTSRLRRYVEKRRRARLDVHNAQIYEFDFLGSHISSKMTSNGQYYVMVIDRDGARIDGTGNLDTDQVLPEIVSIMDDMIYNIVMNPRW